MTTTETLQANATETITGTQPAAEAAVTNTLTVTTTAPLNETVAQADGRFPLAGVWTWVDTTMSDGTVIAPQNEGHYGMRFLYNGRIDIFAECNRVVGRYSLKGGNLQLRIDAATDLYCGPGSDSRVFTQDLRRVTDALLQDNNLYLTLETDSGTMHFTRQ
jgi:heat shock protein HslJ